MKGHCVFVLVKKIFSLPSSHFLKYVHHLFEGNIYSCCAQFGSCCCLFLPLSNSLFSLTLFTSYLLSSSLIFFSSSSTLPFPLLSAVEVFEEVTDSLCVPQYNNDGEERVILFLKMASGKPFCPELVGKIKGAIRKALSARHVPALMLETRDIPVRET